MIAILFLLTSETAATLFYGSYFCVITKTISPAAAEKKLIIQCCLK